jgi:hypothetical protein
VQTGFTHAPQQLRHRREWPNERQVFRSEQLAAPILHFRAMIPLFSPGEKNGNELITAFTNLAASLFEGHVVTELDQRLLPSARM